ncbi:ubiquitin-related domain-containing protein [Zychaea mexicana]|uniref:ubiquitin-related domain-containing protein n=1 Tax=Zychaea mexicana TaxID=64656 RepID=UPI0022FE93BC|nr:ubiquitin-related domain-containing protein [Zychaea mexicana]KAI9498036.1 ubiquitin-related domain-containing protein [Zychaea mexicana]
MDWLLANPNVSDEPEEPSEHTLGEKTAPASGSEQAAGGSAAGAGESEEGEIQNGEQTAQSLICNDCQKLFRDAATAERHAIKTSHQNFSESTEVIAPLTEEEKQAKLAELKARLAEKQASKAKEEAEERRQQEKIRRKAGQDISVAKQQMEEKELKKAFDAKRREKELDRIAKAKVKAQIDADKKERAAKKEAAKRARQQDAQEEAAAAASQPASSAPGVKRLYNEARLQFRVPGASPITHTFPADSTLTQVNEFLQSNGCDKPFTLSMTFPRKTFGEGDLDKTLKDLGLVPSSALVLAYTA